MSGKKFLFFDGCILDCFFDGCFVVFWKLCWIEGVFFFWLVVMVGGMVVLFVVGFFFYGFYIGVGFV